MVQSRPDRRPDVLSSTWQHDSLWEVVVRAVWRPAKQPQHTARKLQSNRPCGGLLPSFAGCVVVLPLLQKSSRNLRCKGGDGFGSVRNEEIDSNILDVVGAELQILKDDQTCGVVRIHKKNTHPLYGESCEPDVIVCPVNMTSPAGSAEQLAGGFDSSPGVLPGFA